MPATNTNYDAALIESWPDKRIENQLYDTAEDSILKRLGRIKPDYQTGAGATIAVKTNRGGGYSVKPAAGGALNTATNAGLAQATFQYTHHYNPMAIESATLDATDGNDLAVATVLDTEVEDCLEELQRQLSRQIVGNGDALICACGTTSASTTVTLNATDGPIAIARNFLHKDLQVDIGTTSNEVLRADGVTITGVSEANGTLTLGSAITTASTDYVSVKDARSGTTSYEGNGMQNIISLTAVLGGLDPATEPEYAAADVDTTAQDLSLALITTKVRKTRQRGARATDVAMGLVQQEKLYHLLQAQARFPGDSGLKAGGVDDVSWAGASFIFDQDIHDKHMYFFRTKDLFMLRANPPHWQNKHTGGQILTWSQGNTHLVATLIYRAQLATRRRNSMAKLTALNV